MKPWPADDAEGNLVIFPGCVLTSPRRNRAYTISHVTGSGSFGQVCKATLTSEDGRPVTNSGDFAIKIIKNLAAYTAQASMEVRLLLLLQESQEGLPVPGGYVKLLDHFVFFGHICIVLEWLPITLLDCISRRNYRGLPLSIIRHILAQLTYSLHNMHVRGLLHCDIKPENVMLGEGPLSSALAAGADSASLLAHDIHHLRCVLIDFGSAGYEHSGSVGTHTYVQSRFYRAPEVLLGLPYDGMVDAWSLGCLAAELWLGLPLFSGCDEHDCVRRMVMIFGHPPESMLNVGTAAQRFFVQKTLEEEVAPSSVGANANSTAISCGTRASSSSSSAASSSASSSSTHANGGATALPPPGSSPSPMATSSPESESPPHPVTDADFVAPATTHNHNHHNSNNPAHTSALGGAAAQGEQQPSRSPQSSGRRRGISGDVSTLHSPPDALLSHMRRASERIGVFAGAPSPPLAAAAEKPLKKRDKPGRGELQRQDSGLVNSVDVLCRPRNSVVRSLYRLKTAAEFARDERRQVGHPKHYFPPKRLEELILANDPDTGLLENLSPQGQERLRDLIDKAEREMFEGRGEDSVASTALQSIQLPKAMHQAKAEEISLFADWIVKLLHFDPTRRMTLAQSLRHPFLAPHIDLLTRTHSNRFPLYWGIVVQMEDDEIRKRRLGHLASLRLLSPDLQSQFTTDLSRRSLPNYSARATGHHFAQHAALQFHPHAHHAHAGIAPPSPNEAYSSQASSPSNQSQYSAGPLSMSRPPSMNLSFDPNGRHRLHTAHSFHSVSSLAPGSPIEMRIDAPHHDFPADARSVDGTRYRHNSSFSEPMPHSHGMYSPTGYPAPPPQSPYSDAAYGPPMSSRASFSARGLHGGDGAPGSPSMSSMSPVPMNLARLSFRLRSGESFHSLGQQSPGCAGVNGTAVSVGAAGCVGGIGASSGGHSMGSPVGSFYLEERPPSGSSARADWHSRTHSGHNMDMLINSQYFSRSKRRHGSESATTPHFSRSRGDSMLPTSPLSEGVSCIVAGSDAGPQLHHTYFGPPNPHSATSPTSGNARPQWTETAIPISPQLHPGSAQFMASGESAGPDGDHAERQKSKTGFFASIANAIHMPTMLGGKSKKSRQ